MKTLIISILLSISIVCAADLKPRYEGKIQNTIWVYATVKESYDYKNAKPETYLILDSGMVIRIYDLYLKKGTKVKFRIWANYLEKVKDGYHNGSCLIEDLTVVKEVK